MDIVISLVALLGFIALTAGTGLFVAIEFALTGLERSTVDNDVEQRGDSTSQLVRQAHGDLSRALSGAQLGITITTLATGYLAEPILAKFFTPGLEKIGLSESASTPIAMVLSLLIATGLSMVYGELVPKNLAITSPLAVARVTVRPVLIFNKVFSLFIESMNRTANWIVTRIGIEPADELASARSPQELSALVRHSAGDDGEFDTAAARILDRSLKFGETTAADIMTPRSTVDWLHAEDNALDLIAQAHESGHSRFPVTNGDLDDTIGVVHVKDALTVPLNRRPFTELRSLARPIPVVPSSLGGDAVLNQVRSAGSQLVLVADEYGGTAGIVTIEDVVEEILGELWDEHDNRDEDAEIRRRGQIWELSGLVRTDELADACGYAPPEGPYETVGGLILHTLGKIPSEGDVALLPPNEKGNNDAFKTTSHTRWQATVLSMDNRRVDKIALRTVDLADKSSAEKDNPSAQESGKQVKG